MNYKTFYLQASEIADRIAEGDQSVRSRSKEGIQEAQEGLVSRRQQIEKPEAPPEEEFGGFLAEIFKTLDSEVTEKGIVVSKAKEGVPKPAARGLPHSRSIAKEYSMSREEMESLITEEAKLRGITPEIALRIFYHEGAGAYQSQIARQGKGSLGGLEASFGPYQLFTGGGLGNEYEKVTGRSLIEDNTPEGIATQIRFALDKAAEQGWGAWYGRKPAGVGVRDGLDNAKPVGNWRT